MIWTTDIASVCFWAVAVVNVALSISLVMRLRRVSKPAVSASHFTVANGQRKDNWLLSGVVWGALFMRPWADIQIYFLLSLPVLVWLLQRTVQRLRALYR